MLNLDKIIKINPTGVKLQSGRILVSSPFLHDFIFGRSVILLTEHGETGAIGLVLNKRGDLFLDEIIEDFPIRNINVYAGGPVNTDNLFILHTYGNLIEDSVRIDKNIYWGGDFEQIKDYLSQGIIQASGIKFFLGYSGWEENQLEDELKKQSWIISNNRTSIDIISSDEKYLWRKFVESYGNKYQQWFIFPSKPSDN